MLQLESSVAMCIAARGIVLQAAGAAGRAGQHVHACLRSCAQLCLAAMTLSIALGGSGSCAGSYPMQASGPVINSAGMPPE